MALKSTTDSGEPLDIEEQLELLEQQIERLKVMYEQYFMGIQKMAPGQLHRDLERGIRELTQRQIRNTALRYRFTNISQKFGSYNTYWRRTMNEIENGRYIRHISARYGMNCATAARLTVLAALHGTPARYPLSLHRPTYNLVSCATAAD